MSTKQLVLVSGTAALTVFAAYQLTAFTEDVINIKGETTEGLIGSIVIYGTVVSNYVMPVVYYSTAKARQIAGAFVLGAAQQVSAITQAEWIVLP